MKGFKTYYEAYWEKRLHDSRRGDAAPIRKGIPAFLHRYTQYGSCANLAPQGARLLDVGCGEGNVTELYSLTRGCEAHGLEISETAAAMARTRGVQAVIHDLNETPYPFPAESFDAVTAVDVPEHLLNPVHLFQQAHRMLRPGGVFICQVPNFARLGNRLRMLLLGDPRDILHWGGYGDGMEHLHWFTKPKLDEFLREAGFSSVVFQAVGLPWGFLCGMVGRHNWATLLLALCTK